MKGKIIVLLGLIFTLAQSTKAQVQDSTVLVSAFFGLDNALPNPINILCPGGAGMDGIPLNFKFPIDPTSLAETDFEVLDSLGNSHTPMCVTLAPANENGENRTVLLIGDFGTAGTNPPVEVRVIGDVFTTNVALGETACSEIRNLNGLITTNVVRLSEGPSLFFAQKIEGALDECVQGSQTIQVAWDGGVVPFISGDVEEDLFQYYTGYSDSAGILVPHSPIAIADINDNDNFHQLCFATTEEIVKISILANTVEDPNQDSNAYSEIELSYCNTLIATGDWRSSEAYKVYPNPFSDEVFIENLQGAEQFVLHDFLGRIILHGPCTQRIELPAMQSGIYYLTILNRTNKMTYKLLKL